MLSEWCSSSLWNILEANSVNELLDEVFYQSGGLNATDSAYHLKRAQQERHQDEVKWKQAAISPHLVGRWGRKDSTETTTPSEG